MYPLIQRNSNGPAEHMDPHILQKGNSRGNSILDALSAWFTQ